MSGRIRVLISLGGCSAPGPIQPLFSPLAGRTAPTAIFLCYADSRNNGNRTRGSELPRRTHPGRLFFRKEQFRIRFDLKPCKIFFISILFLFVFPTLRFEFCLTILGKILKSWIISSVFNRDRMTISNSMSSSNLSQFVFPILRHI